MMNEFKLNQKNMKFLAIEKENIGVQAAQFTQFLKEESIKILELFEKGII